jgi:hypothetical protein
MSLAVLGEGNLRDLVIKKALKEYYQWMAELGSKQGFQVEKTDYKVASG